MKRNLLFCLCSLSLWGCQPTEPPKPASGEAAQSTQGDAPEESAAAGAKAEPPQGQEEAREEARAGEGAAPVVKERGEVAGMIASPERYHRVVPRLGYPIGERYGDMCYEGNNLVMRGPRDVHDRYKTSGEEVAQRWREAARGVGCVFVLRDSLFSQQDHLWRQEPLAPMLPPAWVTAAVELVRQGKKLEPMHTWDHNNDAAWSAVKEPRGIFGSFPPSDKLYELATSSLKDARELDKPSILNARKALKALAEDVSAIIQRSGLGPEEVAHVGALRISRSDKAYFTPELRRDRVVPIFVENPNQEEIAEGKGMIPVGVQVDPESARIAREAIYKRRLADGDLALERYDISRPEERKRAIAVLEALIPKEEPGRTTVWLWVTGPLEEGAKLKGEDATTWIGSLRLEMEEANINRDRLKLLSKPSAPIPAGSDGVKVFDETLTRYEALELPLSVNLDTAAVRRLIEGAERLRQE